MAIPNPFSAKIMMMANSFLHTEIMNGEPVIQKQHHVFVVAMIIIAAIVLAFAAYEIIMSTTAGAPVTTPVAVQTPTIAQQLAAAPVQQSMPPMTVRSISSQLNAAPAKVNSTTRSGIVRQLQMSEI